MKKFVPVRREKMEGGKVDTLYVSLLSAFFFYIREYAGKS